MLDNTPVTTQDAVQRWAGRTDRPAQLEDDVPALAAAVGVVPRGDMPKEPIGERAAHLVLNLPADGWVDDLPAWRAFTGQSREAVRGQGWLAAVHPQDRNHVARARELALTTHKPLAIEYRIRRRDGVYRWFSVHTLPIDDAQGRVCGWASSAIDITDRQEHAQEREESLARAWVARRVEERNRLLAQEQAARMEAEAALARAQVSEARFQRLVDANIIGVAVSDGDHVLEANDAFLQLLGYSREDLEVGCLSRRTLNAPEHLNATTRAIQEATTRGACAPFEKEYVRLDGTRVPVLVGIVRLEGEPLRFVTFVVDLREQKRLAREREEALRSREEWFHTMADTAPVLLWVAGPDALVTFLNAPWLRFTGRSLEQELGNGWAEGVHPDDYQRCLEMYLTAFHARQPFTMEYRLRRFDGEYRWLLDNGVPRYAPDGAFLGYIGSAIDFTEHLQLEREREAARANELALREVNQHMEEFLATAAHDLRNPVMAVYGFVQLALLRLERLKAEQAASVPPAVHTQAGASDSAETRRNRLTDPVQALDESLRAAEDGMERLSRLVTRLFDVARARAGTLDLQLAPCDLAALVREQVEAQRAATPDRTIRLKIAGTPGMSDRQEGLAMPVLADADRLGQVLANYLTNAHKYSSDDAPITVRLDVDEATRTARVAVRDAGPGLPPEEQGRIWESFHRAPGVAPRSEAAGKAGSLGLGLHICKTIIEGHGGEVGVDSALDQGSTFWFTLPLADVDERATAKLHAGQGTRQ